MLESIQPRQANEDTLDKKVAAFIRSDWKQKVAKLIRKIRQIRLCRWYLEVHGGNLIQLCVMRFYLLRDSRMVPTTLREYTIANDDPEFKVLERFDGD